jgi:predicted thioesterase
MAIQGNRISIQSTIKRKEKRKLLFSIVAKLNDIQIAEAEHTRIIISKKILNRKFKL